MQQPPRGPESWGGRPASRAVGRLAQPLPTVDEKFATLEFCSGSLSFPVFPLARSSRVHAYILWLFLFIRTDTL